MKHGTCCYCAECGELHDDCTCPPDAPECQSNTNRGQISTDVPGRIWVDGPFIWPDGEAGGVEYIRADKPTPEALERWAEWFDDPKNPCPVLNTTRYAPAKLTAGFLLREIARVMRDLAGEDDE